MIKDIKIHKLAGADKIFDLINLIICKARTDILNWNGCRRIIEVQFLSLHRTAPWLLDF